MNRLLALVGVVVLAACGRAPSEDARPNIVLIIADDLGWSDAGAFGGEIKTPHIDSLAESGMMLTNFNVNTTCSPTRAMLYSGADAHLVGYGTMPGPHMTEEQRVAPGYETHLNDRVVTFPQLLLDAGYHTYLSGKWDQGGRGGLGRGPEAFGFERSFVLVEGLADNNRTGIGVYPFLSPVTHLEDGKNVELPEDFYSSRSYTDKLMDYIRSGAGDARPFFALLSFTAPHYPIQAPEDDLKDYEGVYEVGYDAIRAGRVERQRELGLIGEDWEVAPVHEFWPRWETLSEEMRGWEAKRMQGYAGMVQAMDRNIGRLLAFLDDEGLADNTVVMFMSDNGPDQTCPIDFPGLEEFLSEDYSFSSEDMGKEGSFTWAGPGWGHVSATPFRYHKLMMTRGGVLSAAIVRAPGRTQAGTRSGSFLTVMDVMPTFLELAETEHPGAQYQGRDVIQPEGASMTALFEDPGAQIHGKDYVFAVEMFERRMVQKGDWKIVWANKPWGEAPEWQLFNLSADPTEIHDLAESEPERLEEMAGEWRAYTERVGAIEVAGFVFPAGSTRGHYEWRPTDARD